MELRWWSRVKRVDEEQKECTRKKEWEGEGKLTKEKAEGLRSRSMFLFKCPLFIWVSCSKTTPPRCVRTKKEEREAVENELGSFLSYLPHTYTHTHIHAHTHRNSSIVVCVREP